MKHYNEDYFNWQKNIGAFGGVVNLFKFEKYIREDDKVLDFGSGGGFLLANIQCKEKLGVEINPTARANANKLGINTLPSNEQIKDEWADVIISHHALEHVEHPLSVLQELYKKLKPDGKIIFVVPMERNNRYVPNDINFHLYTWSEMNLGNLFTLAGFQVKEVKEIKHRWPPHFMKIRKSVGPTIFNTICKVYARYRSDISQVRVVATKSSQN